jgi:DNA-binding beta-propeller fold protein YncE
MRRALALLPLACATLAAQIPPPDALPDHPFFIKKSWIIGGRGNWDYLTLDPAAGRLYIAHAAEVQVVDVETGNLAGAVKGMREAHSIALDSTGEFGYVSDGVAGDVKVFDRRTFEVVASIPTAPAPRAIALDAGSNLLVAICAVPNPGDRPASPDRRTGRPPQRGGPSGSAGSEGPKSVITVIDTESRMELAEIMVTGKLSFAQADGNGEVYIAAEGRNAVARLDVEELGPELRRPRGSGEAPAGSSARPENRQLQLLDWRDSAHPPAGTMHIRFFPLGSGCREPRALAVDRKDNRVFAACGNMTMAVLDANTGNTVTTLPTGPGADAVGYDPDRSLIFTANGGAQGSLTVIRQDVTESYAVIQTLPTRQQARTLAVNSSTGQVYLVTVIDVAKLGAPPVNGIGTLKMAPQDSSFQVLVVGN